MSLGLHDNQARARRRWLIGFVKWTLIAAVLGLGALFAYSTGVAVNRLDTERLQTQVTEVTAKIRMLETENAGLRAARAQADEQVKAWEQRYRADLPQGGAKIVLDLAQQKLKQGVSLDRLKFLLAAAANPRTCDPELENKRLSVKTDLNKTGKEQTVAFAGRRVTITAEGQSVLDKKGNKEAWYDPAQPVVVRFALVDGQEAELTGMLPLQHSFVVGDSEYRFAIAADERRGFAVVTSERCDFP